MSIPFKINFFKQIEIFQEISKLDKQFDHMLIKWEENKAKGISRCYPLWEIEKKILCWTTKHHKYLGSPLRAEFFMNADFKERFSVDSYISDKEVELDSANGAKSLENLVIRGLAEEKGGGIVINKNGLEWGNLISNLYNFNEDKKSSFREYKMLVKKEKVIGYYLMYYTTLLIIWYSILFLCLNILEITNLLKTLSSILGSLSFFKNIISVAIIFPVVSYFISIMLISFRKKS